MCHGSIIFVSVLSVLLGLSACSPPGQSPATPKGASLPTDFHRGVNYAHIHREGHGYGSPASAAELANLKNIGVNWIAITPFAYQQGATADRIVGFAERDVPDTSPRRRDPTLTDRHLTAEVAAAHSLGIKVTLKPHIWSRDFWDGKEWQGSIRQATAEEHARWWESFRAFALHYAKVATESKVDLYCIGTELVVMTTDHLDEWRALIADIRNVYHGPLTYCAHSASEFEGILFWDALDFIGISAYFPLQAPENATVPQLVSAWKPHRERIEKLQKRFARPVLFMEIGYRAVDNCYLTPWTYSGGRPDPEMQARAYEAVFRSFADAHWWQGAYFWKTFTDPKLADARGDGTDFSFRGKPAESVVRKWYNPDTPSERYYP